MNIYAIMLTVNWHIQAKLPKGNVQSDCHLVVIILGWRSFIFPENQLSAIAHLIGDLSVCLSIVLHSWSVKPHDLILPCAMKPGVKTPGQPGVEGLMRM